MSTKRAPIAVIDRGEDSEYAYRLAIYRREDCIEIAEESRKVGKMRWSGRWDAVEIPFSDVDQFLAALDLALGRTTQVQP